MPLPAISSHVVCSTITQQTPVIAGGALASMAHVPGQVSLPYGAGPLATPTAAHEDASDSLHHGSPRSTLNAVRESFLYNWIKSCDFLLEIFHWLLSLRSTGCRCTGSVVVVHRLSCCAACGISPDQELSLCPLHWQADSYPLYQQEVLILHSFCKFSCLLKSQVKYFLPFEG